MNKAQELIEELRNEGCIMSSPCENAADYCCRYCGCRTRTNRDFEINHDKDCMWLKIIQVASELSPFDQGWEDGYRDEEQVNKNPYKKAYEEYERGFSQGSADY